MSPFLATAVSFLNKQVRSPALHKGLLSLTDQSLVSAVNFLTGVLLARFLLPSEYGVFVIIFAIYSFVNNIHVSLIAAPMSTLGPPLNDHDYKIYFSTLLFVQLLFGAGVMVVMLFIAAIISLYSSEALIVNTFFSMSFAVFAFQGKSYFRWSLLAKMRPFSALLTDSTGYGLQIVAVIFLYSRGILSGEKVFLVITITSLLASIIGFYQNRHFLTIRSLTFAAVMRRNFNHGKWLLYSFLSFWLSSEAYIFIIAVFLSSSAVGAFDACRKILLALNIVRLGLGNFIVPLTAKKISISAYEQVNSIMKSIWIWGGFCLALFCGTIALYPGFFLRLFYAQRYENCSSLLMILSAAIFLEFFGWPAGWGLRAMNRPDLYFQAIFIVALLTPLVAIPLVKYRALSGACYGMIVYGTSTALLYNLLYRKEISQMTHQGV
ncbi:lipopolysaccharide biosynthesis protein [candidate division CSSED10-310 bacterium]|uniref:Lipopolysaccharide biosynthesis protein n=1 Tax=candidate division CSSED10-310 bacterium TaxID=2855610 RepID=A0ABV6YWQ3_UNCC1